MVNGKSSEKIPLTFKVPRGLEDKIQELIRRGLYKNKAEMIRAAVTNFIEDEGYKVNEDF